MNLWSPKSKLRLSLAVSSAVLATVICLIQRHIHLELTRPSTYSAILRHRCGLLFLGSSFLALFEAAIYFTATPHRQPEDSRGDALVA